MCSWGVHFESLRNWFLKPWIDSRLHRRYPDRLIDESLGNYGERLAAIFLKRKGYFILEQSFRTRSGEIDIVAVWRKRTVVFVEVKTWQSVLENDGGPADRVDEKKQRKITHTAMVYMKQHRLLGTPGRADVIQIILEDSDGCLSIRHFENAFPAVGSYQMLY